MQSLTLEQKIGQLFFIGVPGTTVDEETQKLVNKIKPGGICLFTRNIREAAQTRRLLDDIKQMSEIQPIFSLDQEGGLVDRLRRVITPMPSARDVSLYGTPEDICELAAVTADIARVLGFNMNFAPVVDVVDERREKFSNGLQSRAIGRNLDETVRLTEIYLREMQKRECLGSIKHFPGIGGIEVDAHDELPTVNVSADEFYATDLKPYRELIEEDIVHCVMVGHAAYPSLRFQKKDSRGNLLPASLNPAAINEVLREELKFDQLVITDDMEMGAIVKNYGMGEACKMALEAGNDMLLICNSTNAINEGFEAVFKAVRDGEISEERINESLSRIFAFKKLLAPPLEFDNSRLAELSARIEALKAKIAK